MSTLKVNAITETDGSAFPFGKVLQVAQTTLDVGNNNIASNSGSPVGSGLITTVTPVAAGSKFLVMHNGNSAHLNTNVSNNGVRFYLYASVASGSYANVANHTLSANLNSAESAYGSGASVFGANNKIDLLSNGFKPRENAIFHNTSGETYVYAAWAETPTFNLYGGGANAR